MQRVITFNQAIRFSSIKIIDVTGKDITDTYKFSWSTDGACWAGWSTYQQYCLIAKNLETDFYLRLLFCGAISTIYVNGVQFQQYTICIPPHVPAGLDCNDPNLFNPYANMECAILLQQQLSDSIICMLGLPIYYFRTDPDASSVDYTFKEFVMHNVVDCKQIKLMIEDGQMPSSNPKLTELDFDWEVDWETEISKTQFAKAFGDNAFPKARDFLYIPLMRRMWEVNAAYDEKQNGIMWRSATWKLSLVKYNESTNVHNSNFDEAIDSLIGKKYQNIFGKKEEIEQERETGFAQVETPKFAATNLYNIFIEDAVRSAYTKDDVNIIDKIYCHNNNIVSRNLYNFKNENGCVTYQKGICGDSGAITMLIETPAPQTQDQNWNIADFGPILFELCYDSKEGEYNIGVENLFTPIQPLATYLVIYKWNRSTHTKELYVYKQIHRTDFPIYLLKPEQYWFDFENPIAELVGSYNNDYIIKNEQPCQLHAYPLKVTNIKLYNGEFTLENIIKESIKYTTTNESCVFADLARPINSGRGFNVR